MPRSTWPLFAALLAAVFSATGCNQNECDRAADHASECQIATLNGREGATGGNVAPARLICAGTVLCEDQCFNLASCDVLRFNGKDRDGEKAYGDCVAACK